MRVRTIEIIIDEPTGIKTVRFLNLKLKSPGILKWGNLRKAMKTIPEKKIRIPVKINSFARFSM